MSGELIILRTWPRSCSNLTDLHSNTHSTTSKACLQLFDDVSSQMHYVFHMDKGFLVLHRQAAFDLSLSETDEGTATGSNSLRDLACAQPATCVGKATRHVCLNLSVQAVPQIHVQHCDACKPECANVQLSIPGWHVLKQISRWVGGRFAQWRPVARPSHTLAPSAHQQP